MPRGENSKATQFSATDGRNKARPGNRNAARATAWKDALRRQLAQYTDDKVAMGEALNTIAKVCVMQALSGDKDARMEIANRLDGKPKETIDATFTQAVAEELTDEQLLDIARGSRDGDPEAQAGEEDATSLQ
jgi:hypothetical protein